MRDIFLNQNFLMTLVTKEHIDMERLSLFQVNRK